MTNSLAILEKLIGFETVSATSNLALITYVSDFLKARDFRVARLDDPDHPRAGLYAEIGPKGRGVVLSAHSDVVPTEGQSWTKPPFSLTRDGDRFYGRGTTDMKGFLAEMLAVADRASRMTLSEPLKLVISYDEEIGCVGIARMRDRLQDLIGASRFALIGEPTEMQLALGHKGKRAYRANFFGEAGHSALAPKFQNALHLAADFIQRLRQLQGELAEHEAQDDAFDIPYSTVHAGKLEGGTALNIVPDRAELLYEFRHLASDDADVLEQQISKVADDVASSNGPQTRIDITKLAAYPGLATDPTSAETKRVKQLAQSDICNVSFGTEAGVFSQFGIPSFVCGPGSMKDQGHKADEFITGAQLRSCAEMLDRVVETL